MVSPFLVVTVTAEILILVAGGSCVVSGRCMALGCAGVLCCFAVLPSAMSSANPRFGDIGSAVFAGWFVGAVAIGRSVNARG